jgi:mono/diheme cytochrome c family protein
MFRIIAIISLSIAAARAEITPGELLIAEMNCVACHKPTADVQQRLFSRPSPRLGPGAPKITPEWMREFLSDPHKTKPGTLMPDMLHWMPPEAKSDAVEALVHYLVAAQGGVPDVADTAIDADVVEGGRLYHDIGCVQCHAPFQAPVGRDAEMAEVATRSVPLAGPEIAKKYSVRELSSFLKNPLKSRPGGRMPGMNLSDSESTAIASFLLRDGQRTESPKFTLDPAKARLGEGYFALFQCGNCHGGTNRLFASRFVPEAKPFKQLKPRQMNGCLAPKPKASGARYDLTERQKTVILASLRSQEILELPMTPEQQLRRRMTALNCFACHSRDRRGGITGLRLEFLADREKPPTSLADAGKRLTIEKLSEVLASGKESREGMPLRMPVFGPENTQDLPRLFHEADSAQK